MSEKTKVEYGMSTGPSYGDDAMAIQARMYRDSYVEFLAQKRGQPGYDFRVTRDTMMVRMPKEQMFITMSNCIKEVLGKDTSVRRLDFDTNHTEISHEHVGFVEDNGKTTISWDDEPSKVRIFVSFRDFNLRPASDYDSFDATEFEASTVLYEIAGMASVVAELAPLVKAKITADKTNHKSAMVKWVYDGGNRAGEQTFQIHKDWVIDKDFYPWMKADLNEYYKAFKESTAKILIVYGPAGTGKTSFIRDMLCELGMNALISFDQKILMSDSTFVNYMMDTIHDCIVMEDSDELLTGGRGDDNKIISKILNVSDGLIKLPSKKMIFSTNLPKVGDIDSAIIRPSRCFDLLEFRLLTFAEAKVVADKYKVLLPVKSHYTLAEIFAEKEMQECPNQVVMNYNKRHSRKMGFN